MHKKFNKMEYELIILVHSLHLALLVLTTWYKNWYYRTTFAIWQSSNLAIQQSSSLAIQQYLAIQQSIIFSFIFLILMTRVWYMLLNSNNINFIIFVYLTEYDTSTNFRNFIKLMFLILSTGSIL